MKKLIANSILPNRAKASLSRFVTKNGANAEAIITAKDGHRFVSINETVFLHLRMEGYYEKSISDITRALIRTGDNVLDVGANFGWYTMLAASIVGPTGSVWSFEPNTNMFAILKKNIDLNGYDDRVHAQNVGLGVTNAVTRLVAKPGEAGRGYVRTDLDGQPEDNQTIQQIEIKVADDLFAAQLDKIGFIKIDVEGFEPFVLLGARKIIESDNPPVIQLEFNSEALQRHDAAVIEQFIDYLNNLPSNKYAGQSGKLILTEKVELGKNADYFIVPKNGRFANRADTLLL